MKYLLTGSTSGLGLSLRNILSSLDHEIVSIDRSSKFNQTKKDYQILINDLYDLDKLSDSLSSNIDLLSSINTCIFNAGTLGLIEAANEISCEKLLHTFTINCLSVKVILDFMLKNTCCKNFIFISSGASVTPYTGWLEYCSTKSFTDSMFRVYAEENTSKVFVSVSPGAISTKMQDTIRENADLSKFPGLKKFISLYESGALRDPDDAAIAIINFISKLSKTDSGSFVKI